MTSAAEATDSGIAAVGLSILSAELHTPGLFFRVSERVEIKRIVESLHSGTACLNRHCFTAMSFFSLSLSPITHSQNRKNFAFKTGMLLII